MSENWKGLTCEAESRRGYRAKCDRPAVGSRSMWLRYSFDDRDDVPACVVHLRAKIVTWAGGQP